MPQFTEIIYEVERGRARILLNRPHKRNALSPRLLHELHDALWEADLDRRVHAVSLAGAGPSFSAGYDLSGGGGTRREPAPTGDGRDPRDGSTIDDDSWFLGQSQRLRMAIFDLPKPRVAQGHGACAAGG